MEALGVLPLCSPKISPSNFDKRCSTKFSRTVQTFKFSGPSSGQLIPVRKTINWKVTRMQVVGEEYELRQMKDMAAARKRWEALVREGKVKPLTPREAGYAIQLTGKTLLDVRPASERNKAWVKGSAWIPIFDVDDKFDVGTLKKGNKFHDGSLAACELLCNAGYQNVFWIQGGLEAAEEEDLQREGSQPFKFAGIGGLSEFLGWTDQQRAAAAKEGWQYRLVFSARMVGLFLAADALYIAAQQVGRYLQEIRS